MHSMRLKCYEFSLWPFDRQNLGHNIRIEPQNLNSIALKTWTNNQPFVFSYLFSKYYNPLHIGMFTMECTRNRKSKRNNKNSQWIPWRRRFLSDRLRQRIRLKFGLLGPHYFFFVRTALNSWVTQIVVLEYRCQIHHASYSLQFSADMKTEMTTLAIAFGDSHFAH